MFKNKKNNKIKWKWIVLGACCFLPTVILPFINYESTPSNITPSTFNATASSLVKNQTQSLDSVGQDYSVENVKTLSSNSKSFKKIYLSNSKYGHKLFTLIYENDSLYFRTNENDDLLKTVNLSRNKGENIDEVNGVSFGSNVLSIDEITLSPEKNSSIKTSIINTNDNTLESSPTFVTDVNKSYFAAGNKRDMPLNLSENTTYLVRFYLDNKTTGTDRLSMFYEDGNGNFIDMDSDKKLQSSINMYSTPSSIAIEGYITKTNQGVTFSFGDNNVTDKNTITGNVNDSMFNNLKHLRADGALNHVNLGNPYNDENEELTWTNFFENLRFNGFSDAQIVLSYFKLKADPTTGSLNVSLFIPVINWISSPTSDLKHFVYVEETGSQNFIINGFNTGSFLLKNKFESSIDAIPEFVFDNKQYLLKTYEMIAQEGFGQNNLLENFDAQNDLDLQNCIIDNLKGTIEADLYILNNYRDENGNAITNNIPKNFGHILISNFKTIASTFQTQSQISLPADSILNTLSASESIKNEDVLLKLLFDNHHFFLNNLPSDITTPRNLDINDFAITKMVANDLKGTISLSINLSYYFNAKTGLYENNEPFTFDLMITGFKKIILETTINANPENINLENMLAQDIKDLSNLEFKQYLYDKVVGGGKENIAINNIKSVAIKSFNNLTGTLILSSITLDKYYDANNILMNTNFTFYQNITIRGFKKIISTQLNGSNFNFQKELNTTLASEIKNTELMQLLSFKYREILSPAGIPENFSNDNIIEPLKILDINDKNGTTTFTFNINNFYNDDGVWETNISKELGPITISGFKTNAFVTTIDPAPSIGITQLNQILPQTISQLVNPLSDSVFKQYLYDYVLGGEKTGISIDDIKAVTVQPNSFNNREGNLTLDSITLSKWYDGNNSILQERDKTFEQKVLITDFKKIVPTDINNLEAVIDSQLNDVPVLEVTDEQLKQIIYNAQSYLFKQNSIPDISIENISIVKRMDYQANAIKINFALNSFYNDDEQATWIYNKEKQMGPIVIGGFKNVGLGTYLEQSNAKINLNIYPYEIAYSSNYENEIKQFIFDNVIHGKHGLNVNSIISYTLSSDYQFDNKNGSISIESITLNDWLEDDGTIQRNKPKVFSVAENKSFKIFGFKKTEGATSTYNNSIPIGVDGDIKNLKISELIKNSNNPLLLNWIKLNKFRLFDNLTNDVEITIDSVDQNQSDSTQGLLSINLRLNSYFTDDIFCTYMDNGKIFNLLLNNFSIENSLATVVKSNQKIIVPNIFENTLAQDIVNESSNPTDIIVFKNFLMDEIILGKKENIEIIKYASRFDNTKATLYLDSITLSNVYDKNGVLNNEKTFSNLRIEVTGFLKVLPTSLIQETLRIDDNNSLHNNFAIQLQELINTNDQTTIAKLQELIFQQRKNLFSSNGLPNNFKSQNIVELSTTNINYTDDGYSNLRNGNLIVSFRLNYYFNGSYGSLTNQLSPKFSISLTNLKNDELSTTFPTAPIAVQPQFVEIIPYAINEEDVKKWVSDSINKARSNKVEVEKINYIANNKDGEIKVTKVYLKNIIDCKGDSNTNNNQGWVFNKEIIFKGLKTVKPTENVRELELHGELTNFESKDVSNQQLIDYFNTNKDTIFKNLPLNASVINIKRISSTYNGILELEITLSATYKNDNYYSYDPGTKMRVILSGFVKTDIFEIVPVIVGSVAAVVVATIIVIVLIYFYRKRKYGKVHVISENEL